MSSKKDTNSTTESLGAALRSISKQSLVAREAARVNRLAAERARQVAEADAKQRMAEEQARRKVEQAADCSRLFAFLSSVLEKIWRGDPTALRDSIYLDDVPFLSEWGFKRNTPLCSDRRALIGWITDLRTELAQNFLTAQALDFLGHGVGGQLEWERTTPSGLIVGLDALTRVVDEHLTLVGRDIAQTSNQLREVDLQQKEERERQANLAEIDRRTEVRFRQIEPLVGGLTDEINAFCLPDFNRRYLEQISLLRYGKSSAADKIALSIEATRSIALSLCPNLVEKAGDSLPDVIWYLNRKADRSPSSLAGNVYSQRASSAKIEAIRYSLSQLQQRRLKLLDFRVSLHRLRGALVDLVSRLSQLQVVEFALGVELQRYSELSLPPRDFYSEELLPYVDSEQVRLLNMLLGDVHSLIESGGESLALRLRKQLVKVAKTGVKDGLHNATGTH